jgi:adenylosuccinate synthase
MPNTIIMGSQWGDEGKAKVIDYLTKRSDVVIRYHGGANAGHTVVVEGNQFIFHMVPSGIMYPSKTCVIGNGVVFDAEQFLTEVDELKQQDISIDNRLFISDLAHMVLPYHKLLDITRESDSKKTKIGTTGRGIGPAYADKVNRIGIRTGDLFDWERFKTKLKAAFEDKKIIVENIYKSTFDIDLGETLEKYRDIREKIIPLITDTGNYLYNCLLQKKNLLFEGAQGTFLDIDHGTYPFVTSSNTVSGAVCAGAGIGPSAIDHIVGIVKAYTTRVGNGPFPSELTDATGELLRKEGAEYGATTGRPRRCGWFDSVVIRKAVQLNGFTRIALTKLDVLNTFKEIKICTHYEIDGKKVENFPTSKTDIENIVPAYESHPGWEEDISGFRKFSELPENAKNYVKRVQELCYNIPVLIISVGPERSQTIEVEPI